MENGITAEIEKIRAEALAEILSAKDEAGLYQVKSKFIGKKSRLSGLLSGLAGQSIEMRREVGGAANVLKSEIEERIEAHLQSLAEKAGSADFDPHLPAFPPRLGRLHPLTRTLNEIKTVFHGMGFSVAEGPEVETDHYNFEALNTPKHHPARDMQDTFYLSEEVLLRTHTSPVQIRVMEKHKPPIRIIAPGRVYRHEEISARSYCLFHQVEGLYVDEGVTFGDLKGTLDAFVKSLFGSGVKTKFRPSFFPFTEPSAEMDVQCFLCGAKGCPVCKRTGWLEIGGCGMVDPNVFNAVSIDPEKYTGFAFGMGVERIAMLKCGIDDIRLFYENDVRFLEQFN